MSSYALITGRVNIRLTIPVNELPADSPHLPANLPAHAADAPVDLVFAVKTNPVTRQEFITGLVPAVPFARKLGNPFGEVQALLHEWGPCDFSGTLHIADEDGGTYDIIVKESRAEQTKWIYPDEELAFTCIDISKEDC